MLGMALSMADLEVISKLAIAATRLMTLTGMATRRSAGSAMVGDRSAATNNCTAGGHQNRRIAPSLVRSPPP